MSHSVEIVEDGLLTVAAAAAFLSLARSTLYSAMERGEIVYVKIGRARRIPRRAVVEYAARHLRGGEQVTGGR